MNKHDLRRNALQTLVSGFGRGGLAQVARAAGIDQSYLSRMLYPPEKAGGKNIGEDLADKLTAAYPEWLGSGQTNVAAAPIGARQIPLIDSVQAGMWTEIADAYAMGDGSDFLLTDLDLSAHAFALEIRGDSMLPDFRPGDRVIIDPEIAPCPGDFVVAKNGGNEATFKKYRPRGLNASGIPIVELVPLNDDYPSLHSETSPFQIIGTMVEHRRYRRK